jgi:hypothetical protein
MVLTKAKKKQILFHVLEQVFEEEVDSNLHKVVAHNNAKSIFDITVMEDSAIDLLKYRDDNKNVVDIAKFDAGLLKSFKAFVQHRINTNNPIEDNDWLHLTADEFD